MAHGLLVSWIERLGEEVLMLIVWSFGPDWPNHGEIDMLEGVNSQSQNKMSLQYEDPLLDGQI